MKSTPELPPEMRARLQRIMAQRPPDSPLCESHWIKQFLRDEWTVLTCKCRYRKPTAVTKPPTIISFGTLGRWPTTSHPRSCCVVSPHDSETHGHGSELDDVEVTEARGLDDREARAALRARAMRPIHHEGAECE